MVSILTGILIVLAAIYLILGLLFSIMCYVIAFFEYDKYPRIYLLLFLPLGLLVILLWPILVMWVEMDGTLFK